MVLTNLLVMIIVHQVVLTTKKEKIAVRLMVTANHTATEIVNQLMAIANLMKTVKVVRHSEKRNRFIAAVHRLLAIENRLKK